jgi:hypothetical protein
MTTGIAQGEGGGSRPDRRRDGSRRLTYEDSPILGAGNALNFKWLYGCE